MTTLIIAAHPDDEVLGCGGTIARLTKKNIPVHIAILGEGETSRKPDTTEVKSKDLTQPERDAFAAADILGAHELFQKHLPDNQFDTVPLLNIIKWIESIIQKVKPTTIYTHSAGDLNIDHNIAHRATLTAARPLPGSTVRKVYAYEVLSSTDWAFGFEPAFKPNTFVDITKTLDIKINAMEAYTTELKDPPHPRSSKALKTLAQHRGSTVGLKAAEAFELIRSIKTS